MTLLEIIRKKKLATATVATPATDNPVTVPSVAKVASVAVANQETSKVILLGDDKQDVRRNKVLKMLAENPKLQRAFITSADVDSDNVILTMAIRDLYTFELLIPKDKYDAFTMLALIERGGTH